MRHTSTDEPIDPRAKLEGHIEDGLYNAQSMARRFGAPATEDERRQAEQSLTDTIALIEQQPEQVNGRLIDEAVSYAWSTHGSSDDTLVGARADLDRALEEHHGITASEVHADLMENKQIYAERAADLTGGHAAPDGAGAVEAVTFERSPGATAERRIPQSPMHVAERDRGISRS